MYNLYANSPAKLKQTWSNLVNEEHVYRCLRAIPCKNGEFEEGTLVTLKVLNSTSGELCITDFRRYAKRMITSGCAWFHRSDLENEISDTIKLSLNDFEKMFEPVQEFNEAWTQIKLMYSHYVDIWAIIVGALGLLSIILWCIFLFNPSFIGFSNPLSTFGKICLIVTAVSILIIFSSLKLLEYGQDHSRKKLLKSILLM